MYDQKWIRKDNVEWMMVKWPRFTPKGAVVVKITDAYVLKAGPDAGKKLLAVTEFGKVPDVPRMHRYGAWWSYFVSWTGPAGPSAMDKAELKRIYNDPRVLCRQQMPMLVKQTPR